MSELITFPGESKHFRRQLLTTVSAFVLAGTLCGSDAAAQENAERPTVWIELGGQLERLPRSEDRISPPFALATQRPDFETTSPISLLRPPRYGVGGEGKISFAPTGSDWVFSAAVRYGRSNGNRHFHNQTNTPTILANATSDHHMVTPGRFEDAKTDYRETHSIADFTVGRDVGLGLFGDGVANLGVRYAQFSQASTVSLSAKPDFIKNRVKSPFGVGKYYSVSGFHNYLAQSSTERTFHGVGPSLSFNGSTPLSGTQDGGLAFDWGVNGAVLFGRQHAGVTHTSYGHYQEAKPFVNGAPPNTYHRTNGHTASHSVTVPNVGAFAGLSMRYTNAKVSFGYRADLFFGAMDGGLDARKTYDQSFYGPFATISIGLGG